MRPGEAFEIQCYEYLCRMYQLKEAKFVRKGGMDSTTSDIAVLKNRRVDYYIEAKDAAAQSGQFVLLPDKSTRQFIFSPRNHSEPNEMTKIIIDYMNADFDRFNNAGTAGQPLSIDQNVFSNWIIRHYKERNVKYFISKKDDYVILPIRRFTDYFNVTANYRVKKSGSSVPAKKDIAAIQSLISSSYPTVKFDTVGKKLYADINRIIAQARFDLGNYTYFFSPQSTGKYEIRRLSNTYNMTVIFSIHLKHDQNPADLKEFEADL